MANLVNPPVEQKLLICALETRSNRIQAEILTETSEDDYGTDDARAIRKRMDRLLTLGKSLGDAEGFSEDPALTGNQSTLIKATPQKRKSAGSYKMEQVTSLIHKLKMHRNIRIIFQAQQKINDLAAGAVDEEGIESIAQTMESTLVGIRDGFDQQPLFHLGKRQTPDLARKKLDDLITFKPGAFVSTGLAALDQHVHGWERSNMVTLSAPSGGGKTTMALQMAVNQYARTNKNVCFVSLEMSETELLKRTLSCVSGVLHDRIRYSKNLTSRERTRAARSFRSFHKHGHKNNCTFTIWDVKDPMFTPQKLEANLAPYMFDLIYIDYITLMYGQGMDTWKMQLDYSRYFKGMAKRLKCVPVLLTQLSEEERVKYGKGIQENTDYWLWWKWGEEEEESKQTELRLAKARHTGKRRIPATMAFEKMRIYTENAGASSQGSKEVSEAVVSGSLWDNDAD